MKKLGYFLLLILFVGCGGSTGPEGPQGPPGPTGKAYEVQASFGQSNNYSVVSAFPENIEVLPSDIVMVYLLWEVDQNTGNDVWQPLPVSVFFDDGELQYGFDHTVTDVKLFLTGDKNLNTVGNQFTQDQIFRIAILPVDYVQSNNINPKNADEVMEIINPTKIQRKIER